MKVLALRRTSKSITAHTTYIYTFKGTTSLETLHAMACKEITIKLQDIL